MNNAPIPKEVCEREPILNDIGFYRRLNDDVCKAENKPVPCYEFISFCNAKANEWLAMHNQDYNEILDKYLPEKK